MRRVQDADQDALVELFDDNTLANLLENQLMAHPDAVGPTSRAAIRSAIKRLRQEYRRALH